MKIASASPVYEAYHFTHNSAAYVHCTCHIQCHTYLLLILCTCNGQCALHSNIIKMAAVTVSFPVNALPQTWLVSPTLQTPHFNWAYPHPIHIPAESRQFNGWPEELIFNFNNITHVFCICSKQVSVVNVKLRRNHMYAYMQHHSSTVNSYS